MRPIRQVYTEVFKSISIHAPAWGATKSLRHLEWSQYISIHAPAWGATRHKKSRSRLTSISIHAPAWGATTPFHPFKIDCSNFNPRTRMGCDKVSLYGALFRMAFQSTHPHGVRRAPQNAWYNIPVNFNPRTRMGCDKSRSLIMPSLSKFQSTHPHGVRRGHFVRLVSSFSFQSTHPHGVRPLIP